MSPPRSHLATPLPNKRQFLYPELANSGWMKSTLRHFFDPSFLIAAVVYLLVQAISSECRIDQPGYHHFFPLEFG